MSRWIESLKIAFGAVMSSKMRTFLSVLGVLVGILSVSLMGTAISGINSSFEKSMEFLGNDVLYVEKMPWFQGASDYWEFRSRPDIREEYASKIPERSNYFQFAAPEVETFGEVKFRSQALDSVMVIGSSWQYSYIHTVRLQEGRFFSPIEDRTGSRVTIISAAVADALFPNGDALGRQITIEGMFFKVIGVMKNRGKFMKLLNLDNQCIIPFRLSKVLFGSWRESLGISVRIKPGIKKETAGDELTAVVRTIRGLKPQEKNNFSINHQEAFRSQVKKIRVYIAAAGLGITALALLVGGIGIMNIMFVSVKERTREIGIRKALGAGKGIILFQFLSEAVIISLVGGVAGLLLTVLAVSELNRLFVAQLSVRLVLISLAVSIVTGIISGLVPARHAARLHPIEAIRSE